MLNPRHRRVADNYLKGYSKVESARLEGYDGKNINVQACNILKRPEVKEYINEQKKLAQKIAQERSEISLEEIIEFYKNTMRDEEIKLAYRIKCAENLTSLLKDDDEDNKDYIEINVEISGDDVLE